MNQTIHNKRNKKQSKQNKKQSNQKDVVSLKKNQQLSLNHFLIFSLKKKGESFHWKISQKKISQSSCNYKIECLFSFLSLHINYIHNEWLLYSQEFILFIILFLFYIHVFQRYNTFFIQFNIFLIYFFFFSFLHNFSPSFTLIFPKIFFFSKTPKKKQKNEDKNIPNKPIFLHKFSLLKIHYFQRENSKRPVISFLFSLSQLCYI